LESSDIISYSIPYKPDMPEPDVTDQMLCHHYSQEKSILNRLFHAATCIIFEQRWHATHKAPFVPAYAHPTPEEASVERSSRACARRMQLPRSRPIPLSISPDAPRLHPSRSLSWPIRHGIPSPLLPCSWPPSSPYQWSRSSSTAKGLGFLHTYLLLQHSDKRIATYV
jgi:hypothetical protein